MTKINIKNLELNIDIIQILNLYSLKSPVFIDVNGKIYKNKDEIGPVPIIYKNDNINNSTTLLDAKAIAANLFSEYKPNINGAICKIKPLNNWQNIIGLNQENMLYFDHQSDGVEIFEDKVLEDFGWNASALEINYRAISDFIEENCEGTLLFYDNEIQFNGFAIVEDILDVRNKVKEFIINKTKENIENEIIDIEDEDVIESLEYFQIKV